MEYKHSGASVNRHYIVRVQSHRPSPPTLLPDIPHSRILDYHNTIRAPAPIPKTANINPARPPTERCCILAVAAPVLWAAAEEAPLGELDPVEDGPAEDGEGVKTPLAGCLARQEAAASEASFEVFGPGSQSASRLERSQPLTVLNDRRVATKVAARGDRVQTKVCRHGITEFDRRRAHGQGAIDSTGPIPSNRVARGGPRLTKEGACVADISENSP
jgi:hypothetical protein